MDPNTGHLIDISRLDPEKVQELQALGYIPIPPELDRAARRALKGEAQTHVSVRNNTELARFATKKRKQRRKMAKESRQRNRVR